MRKYAVSIRFTTLYQQCVKGARVQPAGMRITAVLVPALDSAPSDRPPCSSLQSVLPWVILTDIDPSYWLHVLHLQTSGRYFSFLRLEWQPTPTLVAILRMNHNFTETDTGGPASCFTHFILPCLMSFYPHQRYPLL